MDMDTASIVMNRLSIIRSLGGKNRTCTNKMEHRELVPMKAFRDNISQNGENKRRVISLDTQDYNNAVAELSGSKSSLQRRGSFGCVSRTSSDSSSENEWKRRRSLSERSSDSWVSSANQKMTPILGMRSSSDFFMRKCRRRNSSRSSRSTKSPAYVSKDVNLGCNVGLYLASVSASFEFAKLEQEIENSRMVRALCDSVPCAQMFDGVVTMNHAHTVLNTNNNSSKYHMGCNSHTCKSDCYEKLSSSRCCVSSWLKEAEEKCASSNTSTTRTKSEDMGRMKSKTCKRHTCRSRCKQKKPEKVDQGGQDALDTGCLIKKDSSCELKTKKDMDHGIAPSNLLQVPCQNDTLNHDDSGICEGDGAKSPTPENQSEFPTRPLQQAGSDSDLDTLSDMSEFSTTCSTCSSGTLLSLMSMESTALTQGPQTIPNAKLHVIKNEELLLSVHADQMLRTKPDLSEQSQPIEITVTQASEVNSQSCSSDSCACSCSCCHSTSVGRSSDVANKSLKDLTRYNQNPDNPGIQECGKDSDMGCVESSKVTMVEKYIIMLAKAIIAKLESLPNIPPLQQEQSEMATTHTTNFPSKTKAEQKLSAQNTFQHPPNMPPLPHASNVKEAFLTSLFRNFGDTDVFTWKLSCFLHQTLEIEAKEKEASLKQLASALRAQQQALEVSYCSSSLL